MFSNPQPCLRSQQHDTRVFVALQSEQITRHMRELQKEN